MSYTEFSNQPEYSGHFWNAMRGHNEHYDKLHGGYDNYTSTYSFPDTSNNKLEALIKAESIFRNIATVFKAYRSSYRIFAKDCEDLAEFIPDGGQIPIYDGINDFTINTVDSHKLAAFIKLDEDFVSDAAFGIEDYLTKRFAGNFANAEDKAFICGSGVDEPTGILNDGNGAEVGATASALIYDDVISLYFSIKPKYRKKAVWLMNDNTAMALRKLKDKDGNYLWNNSNDTILGKQVLISEFMPDADAGAKPIAFGDFSYYWAIFRKRISVRSLTEKFVLNNQIGYLAFEFLDGKLVRRDAVKVLQIF